MKFYLRRVSTRMLALSLVGCASTGGTIGGLVPAPKLTKGDLTNGVYVAQDQSFSVNSPFPTDSYFYTYMEIKENYTSRENNVQFSSSAAPAEVYRVNIFKDVKPEEKLSQVLISGYRETFENEYGTKFENHKSGTLVVSGVEATFNSYSQHIPERSGGGRTAIALDVLHDCYYLEKGINAAFVCTNRQSESSPASNAGAEARLRSFIESFNLH